MSKRVLILLFFIFASHIGFASDQKSKKTKVVYKSGERLDFQSLLIEGEKKKANFSVVTGNLGEIDLGLLKIREDFVDYMKDSIREKVQ